MKSIRFVLLIALVLGFVSFATPALKAHAEGVCSLTVKLTANRADFVGKSANESNVWKDFSFGDSAHTEVYLDANGSFITWHDYDARANYTASFQDGCSVDVVFISDPSVPGPAVQIGSCTLPAKIHKLMQGDVRANGNANIDVGKGEIFGMTREWIGLTVDITANGKLIGKVKIADNPSSNHWTCSSV